MDRCTFASADMAHENVEKLGALFPAVVTESRRPDGTVAKGIDFEKLKLLLGQSEADGDEWYELTWVGKRAAIAAANRPTTKTLRPVKEESKDWETTGNLYLEGDNLEVLKILQESYLKQVKMIYIDPPYNTGHDFIYPDTFTMDPSAYHAGTGYFDENGHVNFARENSAGAGRYHSDWCSMMYARLTLARNLLKEDGVICISIDDNEVANLKALCNEIFGEQNFEGHIHWRRRHNQPNDKTKMIGLVAEHILVYAKNSAYLKTVGVGKLDITATFSNPDQDPRGPWASKPWKVASDQSGSAYTIVTPAGKRIDGEWMGDEDTYRRFLEEGRIYFPKNGEGLPRKKYYQSEREAEGQCATNWWPHEQFGHNQGANECMTELFGVKNIFSNPKPVELLRGLLKISNVTKEDLVLDFFSGSGATAHAVMQLNAEDGGRRKFIMVQLPEPCREKSEAYQAGYRTICEIGKERIRRAGEQLKERNPQCAEELDIGFRVFRVDEGPMKEVSCQPEDLDQMSLLSMVSNIKEDRTDLDLLYACLLDAGVAINRPHRSTQVEGCTVHQVDGGALIACFDACIPATVMDYMAAQKPHRVVLRDGAFATDEDKVNVTEIFRRVSPETKVKVL